MKILRCEGCRKVVAKIVGGSKLMKGMTALCPICETKRLAADIVMRDRSARMPSYMKFINDMGL